MSVFDCAFGAYHQRMRKNEKINGVDHHFFFAYCLDHDANCCDALVHGDHYDDFDGDGAARRRNWTSYLTIVSVNAVYNLAHQVVK